MNSSSSLSDVNTWFSVTLSKLYRSICLENVDSAVELEQQQPALIVSCASASVWLSQMYTCRGRRPPFAYTSDLATRLNYHCVLFQLIVGSISHDRNSFKIYIDRIQLLPLNFIRFQLNPILGLKRVSE